MDEQQGGGDLPSAFEVAWIGDIELPHTVIVDSDGVFFGRGEQVEAAALGMIGEDGEYDA